MTIEVPGQYVADKEPMTDLHVKLHHVDSNVNIVHRNGYSQRELTLLGHNGRSYSFLVQFAVPHATRTDERIMQLHMLVNQLLSKYNGARKRDLTLHVPLVIPITPRVRLLGNTPHFTSLAEVYENYCIESNKDFDFPIQQFNQKMAEYVQDTALSHPSSTIAKARLDLYTEICSNHVEDSILSQYLYRVFHSPDHLFQFRHEFCKQLALSSFLQYILVVGDRSPPKMLFSVQSGRMLSADMRPGYNATGLLEQTESVPFRLSRNLHRFLSIYSIEGPFANALTSAAMSLSKKSDILENQLSLFFRDDMVSWHISKTQSKFESELSIIESQLMDQISANVHFVKDRVQGLCQTPKDSAQIVYQLIDAASSPANLSNMSPTWYPWL